MQISSPTQAQSSPPESGPPPESSSVEGVRGDSPAVWGSRTQKKNKGGIFAKLLEGLTGKGKKGVPTAGGLEAGGQKTDTQKLHLAGLDISKSAEGELNLAEAEKITLKTWQNVNKSQKTGEEEDSFAEDTASYGVLSLLRQEMPADQGLPASARKEAFSSGGQDSAGEATLKNEGVLSLAAGNEGENRDPRLSPERPEEGPPETLFRDGHRAGKAGREADFSSFTRREDTGFTQSQAILRPDTAEAAPSAKENPRLSELRSKKGRDRFNIQVHDLRTGDEARANGAGSETSGETAFNAFKPVSTEIDLSVDLRLEGRGEGAAGKADLNQRYEDALAGELRGSLSTDIVRDASVIVRNGGEGTIRLSLHPESLGNVKIRLEMAENKITGHIIVESNEALRAFERELPVLEKAFRDSGFSETTLNMSLAQDGGNFSAGGERREADFPAFMPVLAASRYEAETERIEDTPLSGMILSAEPGRRPVNLLI